MINITETEKAYLAGLFDGEGTIGYYFKTALRYHLAQLAIYNCDPKVMTWLKNRVSIGKVYLSKGKNANYKGWQWQLNSKSQIIEFLSNIRPYLIIKADQVDLLFSLWIAEQKIRSKHKLSQDIIDLRNMTMRELKQLKTASYVATH